MLKQVVALGIPFLSFAAVKRNKIKIKLNAI